MSICIKDNNVYNYLKFVFVPWFNINVSNNIISPEHPLYDFQLLTKYKNKLADFINHIFKSNELAEHSLELLTIVTIYMRRLYNSVKYTHKNEYVFTDKNVISSFFICLLLSCKYILDDTINNIDIKNFLYNETVTNTQFNSLEIKVLELLEYKLYISTDEYINTKNCIINPYEIIL
jgi:hypothetical protein